jgi:hypothetical protein
VFKAQDILIGEWIERIRRLMKHFSLHAAIQ